MDALQCRDKDTVTEAATLVEVPVAITVSISKLVEPH